MKERPRGQGVEGRRHRPGPPTDVVERRAAPRTPFIASALVIELNSGAKIAARSCDLVVQGCYVDTMNPFPVGTLVRIRLRKETGAFEAKGRVVYRLAGLGMGLAFYEVTPENQKILEEWLAQAGQEEAAFEASLPPIPVDESAPPSPQRSEQIVELIEMLARKGILTRAEAALLLKEPLD